MTQDETSIFVTAYSFNPLHPAKYYTIQEQVVHISPGHCSLSFLDDDTLQNILKEKGWEKEDIKTGSRAVLEDQVNDAIENEMIANTRCSAQDRPLCMLTAGMLNGENMKFLSQADQEKWCRVWDAKTTNEVIQKQNEILRKKCHVDKSERCIYCLDYVC